MKRIVRNVLLAVVVVCCLSAVVWGGAWCSAQKDDSSCSDVCIVVQDSLQRAYVDADELMIHLKQKGLYPLGKSMDVVDCHAIEACLQGHDMVREVECYKSPFGKVYIDVSQRVPVMYVVANDGCYYVDSDRLIMPARKQIAAEVPVFRGAVSQRAATEEYYDFVTWLSNHTYWSKRVGEIYVSHPKHLVLSQKKQREKIILGALDGYEQKLAKLRKIYTKGTVLVDSVGYQVYDLRFDGQVVAKK